jgi:hypothetical protein
LTEQNNSSHYTNNNQPARPKSNYSCPSSYFKTGIICVSIGCDPC